MKNLQVDFDQAVLDLKSQHQNLVFTEEQVFCSFKKPSVEICKNKKCTANPFVCANSKCDCRSPHEKCAKIQSSLLIRKIKSRTVYLDSIDNLIDQIVQNMIDALSDFRDKISLKLKQDLICFELTKSQKQFFENIEKKKLSSITSSHIEEIVQFEEKKEKTILEIINKSKQQVQTHFNSLSASFLSNFELVTEDIEQLKKRLQALPFCEGKNPENKIISNLISLSKFGSKIVSTQLQDKTLSKFFTIKNMDSIQLFYRASQNDFSIQKFHEKCDGVPHTVVLIETEYGKKIGAYTPIQWKDKGKSVKDESNTSFLFSLTNSDKFELTSNKEFAVYHNSIHGPVFGQGNDLFICDKANINSISHANINYSYYNVKYEFNDKQSWLNFIGNESSRFKIKEWEVWGLSFN